jgi:two-component system OmpR family response regulator
MPDSPRNASVLVVDDDPHIAEVLDFALTAAGYGTLLESSGEGALIAAKEKNPDLIILDINLPGLDGLYVCRKIREFSSVPIIFLSARDEELDRVMGLTLGGDDYVVKPFSPRELIARVEAVLRRPKSLFSGQASNKDSSSSSSPSSQSAPKSSPSSPSSQSSPSSSSPLSSGKDSQNPLKSQDNAELPLSLSIGPLTLDFESHKAFYGNAEVSLTATEFKILRTLAQRPKKVFGRDELLTLVSPNVIVGDRTVDSHILHIRKKFQKAGGEVVFTQHGIGYSLSPGLLKKD